MNRSTSNSWKRLAGKKRWTEADARRVVGAWRGSGLSLQAFARENGIGAWRLRWWAPRVDAAVVVADDSTRASAERVAAPRLVPAVVTDGATLGRDAPAIVVRLPDGIEVEFRDVVQVEAGELGRLVAELRKAGA